MEYFKHDISASEDEKICELLASGGYELLGYYWRFVEYLYSRGGKIKKNNLYGIAWALHMEVDKLSTIICNYDLFCEDETYIYSRRIVKEIEKFEADGKRMAEIGRAGGKASAEARAKRTVKHTVQNNEAKGQAEVEYMVSECSTGGQADAQQKKKEENKIKKNKRERMNECEPCEAHDRSFVQSQENLNPDIDEFKLTALGGIGQNVVLLSDAQMDDLLEHMSMDEFNRYVGIVAQAELSGKHYKKKTHYQAILDMVENDRRLREK